MESTAELLTGCAGDAGQAQQAVTEGAPACPAPGGEEVVIPGGPGAPDAPGAAPEPADDAWRERAEAAETNVAAMGDRLQAVESAASDLRRMLGQSEQSRQIDRELLIAGVVDLDGARRLVDERLAGGATVLEAVARVRERRPLLFAPRVRGVRATAMPAGPAPSAVDEAANDARESGDRRLVLRYLRARRGER
ncbi:MAG: hypothetical protein IT431_03325 [Phycisphaerales bacterium]|nr:hypothetical protein [Phycisphaerales bacterium]